MKTLQKIAEKHGLQLVPVRYRRNGIDIKPKGYDLIDYSRTIYLSFEPWYANDGTRWLMKDYTASNPFIMYMKDIREVTKWMQKVEFSPQGETGYRLK